MSIFEYKKTAMEKKSDFSKLLPIITLYFLSPIVGELLLTSTPVSRANQLIFESLWYGSGALLIREIVRRRGLGWLQVFMLGLCFAIAEECLSLQTVFNPAYLNLNMTYGRAVDVNWVWMMTIFIYHAVWSITLPIFFAELICRKHKEDPWLNLTGIVIFSLLLVLSGVAFYVFFFKMSFYNASWIHFTVAALALAGIALWAVYRPFKPIPVPAIKTPGGWGVGIMAFIMGMLWLSLLFVIFAPKHTVPAMLVIITGIVVVLAVLLVLTGWSKSDWNNNHRFFLASGALLAGMVFGFIKLWQSHNNLDTISQAVFIAIVLSLLVVLKKKNRVEKAA
jgi:hypothetical protein